MHAHKPIKDIKSSTTRRIIYICIYRSSNINTYIYMSVWRFYLIPNGQKGLWRENFFVEKLLSLIIFMRNEIRRAIYSTDYIKSISIYFLSSSIGIVRQIYNHIQIEEYKCFLHSDTRIRSNHRCKWDFDKSITFTMIYILRLQIKLKASENNK